ncbi:MAG: aldo/keto reductase [Planctomycetes bacterium]|nr:aldo/keto reductase [Planctomycetota bacterium]
MNQRPLGRSALRVPPLVLGTMGRRSLADAERVALWRAAIERGFSTLETAPLYGYGAVEELLGRAIAEVPRERVQILGKVGLRWDDAARGRVLFVDESAAGAPRVVRCDARPASVRDDVEQSLRRLRTGHLDLVQVHQPDHETPLDETMGELRELQRRGLVRAIGASNASAQELRAMQRSLGDAPLVSVQPEWNLAARSFEADELATARELELGVLAYSPLDGGRLARAEGAGGALLRELGAAHRCAPAAIALAWLLAQPLLSAAIIGASSLAQLAELEGALDLGLASEDLARLAAEFPRPRRSLVARVRRTVGALLGRAGVRSRA